MSEYIIEVTLPLSVTSFLNFKVHFDSLLFSMPRLNKLLISLENQYISQMWL